MTVSEKCLGFLQALFNLPAARSCVVCKMPLPPSFSPIRSKKSTAEASRACLCCSCVSSFPCLELILHIPMEIRGLGSVFRLQPFFCF